ncbi:sulfite reductase (NADPH) hemoprotein beta-component [Parvibaculum indicum]|uniref:nitrite/sulfite reductase n=1 Tax=Parvibaculum indicum TaxID=562969 RepID=UPI00141E2261|nr:nitrite/sulfite reductase [Parvibaculum indicum]NIJ42465.1 sulfite reductase (NADPH) hemoprotein beta-component [Parvibaculum indicum]
MYRYDEFDHSLVKERVEQFRGQVARRLDGDITEDEFKPIRLMNGLYLQLHAYMLRVAVPYGTLSSKQLRKLADIARKYDRGYGHFTTRQNLQYNWPALKDVPAILDELASVEMHCIQTSGNCIRNVTSDQYAGAAKDEVEDPRIISEVIRQWSTFHPEFSFLPRKFKIAVSGTEADRAAIKVHDIGIQIVTNDKGEVGYQVYVGGGLGRTPMIGKKIGDFVPKADLLAYLEAVMRVYNMNGRRDNLYKSRIKILVHEIGAEEMQRQVEEEFAEIRKTGALNLPQDEIDRIKAYFADPAFEDLSDDAAELDAAIAADKGFAHWVKNNTAAHKKPGYAIVNISLKPIGGTPGDCSADQMDAVAALAEKYSFDELRVTHEQNLTLAHVRKADLKAVYDALKAADLATANVNLITDQIACPGLDYCNLANARSIPIAQEISNRFADIERQHDIGELKINTSGCINACGHHHVGHIGILGVDKKGVEYYQVTLGGSADENTAIGDILGPAFTEQEIPDAIEKIVKIYLDTRQDGERFIDTYRRVGIQPFKENVYEAH